VTQAENNPNLCRLNRFPPIRHPVPAGFQLTVVYDGSEMDELIQRLAEVSNVTPAQAADEVDRLLHKIRRRVRGGRTARLPGLGLFTPGPLVRFRLEESNASRAGSGDQTRRGR
jgi:hypothetical protein